MFHKTSYGNFSLPCDMDGFVAEANDGPWHFAIDHGAEKTHDDTGKLTQYGTWWEEEGFPAWRDAAISATEKANKALQDFR